MFFELVFIICKFFFCRLDVFKVWEFNILQCALCTMHHAYKRQNCFLLKMLVGLMDHLHAKMWPHILLILCTLSCSFNERCNLQKSSNGWCWSFMTIGGGEWTLNFAITTYFRCTKPYKIIMRHNRCLFKIWCSTFTKVIGNFPMLKIFG